MTDVRHQIPLPPVIFLDFAKRKVSRITYDEAALMMREQEARGVKVSAGRPGRGN